MFSSLSANRWGGVGSGSGKSGAGDKIVIGIRLPDKKKITRYEFFKKKLLTDAFRIRSLHIQPDFLNKNPTVTQQSVFPKNTLIFCRTSEKRGTGGSGSIKITKLDPTFFENRNIKKLLQADLHQKTQSRLIFESGIGFSESGSDSGSATSVDRENRHRQID